MLASAPIPQTAAFLAKIGTLPGTDTCATARLDRDSAR